MSESTHNPLQHNGTIGSTVLSLRRVRLALPLIAAGLSVWLVRDVAANIVGTKGLPPHEEPRVQGVEREPLVMAGETVEPRSTPAKPSVAPPSRQGLNKRVSATSDEVPFVAHETVTRPVALIQEWLMPEREWPTNRVQIGDVVYPREALVSQILKGAGSDPALALA